MPRLKSHVAQASGHLLSQLERRPGVGVILGSGLGQVACRVATPLTFRYAEIPHWPLGAVSGHAGMLTVGHWGGRVVAVAQGRHHYYESGDMQAVVFAVEVLAALGCRILIVTNAAGGLRPGLAPGDLMLIVDHINLLGLAGVNPLVGWRNAVGEPAFQPMHDAYEPELRLLAQEAAAAMHLPLAEGVYAMVGGPNYETPAEVRFLRQAGADAVGMSTLPEVLVARVLGMRVLGISCITNRAAEHGAATSHAIVVKAAAEAADTLGELLEGVLERLPPPNE